MPCFQVKDIFRFQIFRFFFQRLCLSSSISKKKNVISWENSLQFFLNFGTNLLMLTISQHPLLRHESRKKRFIHLATRLALNFQLMISRKILIQFCMIKNKTLVTFCHPFELFLDLSRFSFQKGQIIRLTTYL